MAVETTECVQPRPTVQCGVGVCVVFCASHGELFSFSLCFIMAHGERMRQGTCFGTHRRQTCFFGEQSLSPGYVKRADLRLRNRDRQGEGEGQGQGQGEGEAAGTIVSLYFQRNIQ